MFEKSLKPADAQAHALCLGMFRICYASVFFLEVCHLFYFRHLLLDPVPFLQPAPVLLNVLLVVWLGTILCVIAGYRTTISCMLNYLFTVMYLGLLLYPLFEYHVDYVYIGVNFLLMLVPVSDRLSLDAKRKQKKKQSNYLNRDYSIHISALIFVGIALVYADSVFYKFKSPMWLNGLGVWLPASLPQNSWFTVPQFILDQKWLMLTLGYLTLCFETAFPFLMWWKRSRPVLFVIGVGLHISIGIVFPIPLFGLTYFALYLLLIPPSIWNSLDHYLRKTQEVPIALSESLDHSSQTIPISWRTREKIAFFTICFTAFLQTCLIMGRTPDFPEYFHSTTVKRVASLVSGTCAVVRKAIYTPSHILLGISDHQVFVDDHFKNYNRLYSIQCIGPENKKQLLPLTRDTGTTGTYSTGRVWALWCFRVNGSGITREAFENGVKKITVFWAIQNNVSLDDVVFEIESRPVRTPVQWEKGYLASQKRIKWRTVATASWKQRQFSVQISRPPKQKVSETEKSHTNAIMSDGGDLE